MSFLQFRPGHNVFLQFRPGHNVFLQFRPGQNVVFHLGKVITFLTI
jgi:hypothetical protein